jgi:hypothetical protein
VAEFVKIIYDKLNTKNLSKISYYFIYGVINARSCDRPFNNCTAATWLQADQAV